MSIKKMAKEISQITVTMRSEGRKIRWYGRKIQKIKDRIKHSDKKKGELLVQKYKKNLGKLVKAMDKCQNCAHIAHKRLLNLHEALK
ncbi:MAG TPA: hypothetical protein VJB66_04590 [Candidatus Nanoarchaeia archaeon]|nr:hypothetical protein [Candidatus Nanoarchaeia archaeon]